MSMWSVPIVAVPTKRTRLPSSSAAFTRVVERMASTSASRTSGAVSRRPSMITVSPRVSNASAANGMLRSATILIRKAFPWNYANRRCPHSCCRW